MALREAAARLQDVLAAEGISGEGITEDFDPLRRGVPVNLTDPSRGGVMQELLIRVRESEYKPLLDRDSVLSDIKQHLGPWIDLIQDLTNYGSNLIPRCFSSSGRKLEDVVVIGILLRQVVAMLDGVEILLSQGATHAAHLQMRAMFEAYVYIEWILASDSQKKTSYYYVHNLRRKRLWANRSQLGTEEAQDFTSLMGKAVQVSDDVRESSKKQIQEIDRVLSQSNFVQINKDFENYRKGKRDSAWYVPLGQKSFAALTRTIGRESLYVMLYSQASEVMHTSSYDAHVRFSGKKVTFEPIRYLGGFEGVLRFSVSVALLTYSRILREYRAGELPAFSRKYVEKWQEEYMNFLKITYKADSTEI